MSPDESQLRAALRHGEGEVPDAVRLIAGAIHVRRERRRRIASVASAAAVVGLIVAGGTLLVRNDSGDHAQSVFGGGAYDMQRRAAGGSVASPAHAPNASKAACPKNFPHMSMPRGSRTDQIDTTAPLFTAPVAAITVCTYGASPTTTALTGSRAQSFVDAMDAAHGSDPNLCLKLKPRYAFYAYTDSGTPLRVVTATPGCEAYLVTNGIAERIVPFDQFDPLRIGGTTTPPHNEGSPPR